MPIFPVWDLAQKGILRDPSPYQLDLNAWSYGKDVRFHANKVQSGPIFRAAQDAQGTSPSSAPATSPVGAWMPSSVGKDGTSAVATGDGRLTGRVTAAPVDVPTWWSHKVPTSHLPEAFEARFL